ncbi:alkaline phosphatase family protein [Halorubrum pallidum]
MNLGRIKKGLSNPRLVARFLREQGGNALLRWIFDDSGVRVLDQEWDTLVILDCGRYDIFAELEPSSGTLRKKRSAGSVTADFLKRNFSGRRAHDVVYLSANPQVANHREHLDVHKVIGMWHDDKREKQGQENRRGLTDPEPVVDRAIELHEEYPNKRHIVHLLPPHVPHIFKDGAELPTDSPYRNYEAARAGEVDASEMRDIYSENYEYVIDAIQPLIDEIDGKIVVTADHGELLGEGMPRWMKHLHNRWGNQWWKYDFGHYGDIDVPELVDVPWLELPVETRRETVSEPPVTDEYETESIRSQLEALGYR